MTSTFPTSADVLATNHSDLTSEIIHASTINDLASAVSAVENVLLGNTAGTLGPLTIKSFQDKGGQVYSVKAYGAKGDGSTDDASFIQAALDAANAAGGGQVFFPAGTYIIGSTLTLYSKVHLVGSGIEATVIKLKNATNVDMLKGLNFASLTGTDTNAGIYNWSIQDLTVDGNRTNNSSGYGLRVYGYGYILHNFRARQCANDGIYTEWSASVLGGTAGDGTMEAHWSNIMSHDNGGNGVTMAGPHDSKWVNGTVFSNVAKGVYIKHTAVMTGGGLSAANVHSWGNTQTYAWDIEDTVRCIGCVAEGASQSQVRFGSSGNDLYKASLSSWIGGQVFSASGSGIAFEIGSGGFGPISVQIESSVFNCTTALVKFTVASLGGHVMRFTSYQTSGPVVVGTASVNDYIEAVISGGGGPPTLLQVPASITVPQNEGLKSAGATDQIRLKPGGNVSFAALGKASAVNYVVSNPGATGSGVGVFSEGSDGTIDFAVVGKGATSSLTLRSDFGTDVTLEAKGVASAVNHILMNNAISGSAPSISSFGNDANVGLQFSVRGTANIQFMGAGFGIQGVANAVNQINAKPNSAGNGVSLFASGSDGTIGVDIIGKGATSSVSLRSDSSTDSVLEAKGVAAAVNHVLINNAATGNGVSVKAFSGTDTNVDLKIGGQGTGLVQIDYASTALGGGAAASFGTVGGSGPATAAQFKWLAIRDSNDGIVFVPIWH